MGSFVEEGLPESASVTNPRNESKVSGKPLRTSSRRFADG
jgi:hypothetical protein